MLAAVARSSPQHRSVPKNRTDHRLQSTGTEHNHDCANEEQCRSVRRVAGHGVAEQVGSGAHEAQANDRLGYGEYSSHRQAPLALLILTSCISGVE